MQKEEIVIICESCKTSHNVFRTQEIPKEAISMGCNFCPDCQESAEDYYSEWCNFETEKI